MPMGSFRDERFWMNTVVGIGRVRWRGRLGGFLMKISSPPK